MKILKDYFLGLILILLLILALPCLVIYMVLTLPYAITQSFKNDKMLEPLSQPFFDFLEKIIGKLMKINLRGSGG